MSKTKYFEIRDRMTFIPVIAVKLSPELEADTYLHLRIGWGEETEPIYLIWTDARAVAYNPHQWGENPRTMYHAHRYIEKHFDKLETGSVVDVEYILGETDIPKITQGME